VSCNRNLCNAEITTVIGGIILNVNPLKHSGYYSYTYHYTLQFIVTHTSIYSHVFTSRCLVTAPNGGRSPSSGFPNCPRPQLQASNSNSNSDWTATVLWLTHQLTHSKSMSPQHRPHRKQRFPLFLYPIVAMETCLFTESLLSSGCYILAYFVAVA
jgi:hypothetical protein